MKLDFITLGSDLEQTVHSAQRAEARGFDGWFTGETSHDPFLMCGFAAEHTTRIQVGTAIAVAFARNPMTVAYSANDLHRVSGGRFVLGLGSQIRAHIERRFSATWSRPAARMREFVLALRAIWAAWNQGTRLDFRGDFYQHTLMTPFFAPPPNPHGTPPVFIAAVGTRMTEVAGEVADGLLCHSFTTPRYLRHVTLPALERGRAAAAEPREVEVALGVFTITGRDERQLADAARFVRAQIAFYGSTPAYRPVLDIHGWGELQEELHTLSTQGRWQEMADLIDDEILDEFAITAPPEEVGHRIVERYGGLIDRVSLYTPYEFDDEEWAAVAAAVRDGA